ncbi:MAG: hypothetical protein ABJ239_05665 [Erythrobacter sp.]
MNNVQLGLFWATILIAFGLLANALGIGQKLASAFICGVAMLAVFHVGRSEALSKGLHQ